MQFEDRFYDDVKAIFKDSCFINGKYVEKFEKIFSQSHCVKHAVGTSCGTDALSVILTALHLTPSDGVIYYPANTFIGSILSALHMGFKCKPYDICLDTLNSNVNFFSEIGSDAAAVIAVHLYGYGLKDITLLRARCDEMKVPLIEDCSQAHFQKVGHDYVGGFGIASFFSLYPGKNLGAAGDAGVICTNDDRLAQKMRSIRNYGAEKKYHYTSRGYNHRMDAIQAAFLCHKIPFLHAENCARRTIAGTYMDKINSEKVRLLNIDKDASVWHVFPVLVKDRKGFVLHMSDRGIQTNVHYPQNIHHFDIWSGQVIAGDDSIKNADLAAAQVVSIPCHGAMSTSQVETVYRAVNDY